MDRYAPHHRYETSLCSRRTRLCSPLPQQHTADSGWGCAAWSAGSPPVPCSSTPRRSCSPPARASHCPSGKVSPAVFADPISSAHALRLWRLPLHRLPGLASGAAAGCDRAAPPIPAARDAPATYRSSSGRHHRPPPILRSRPLRRIPALLRVVVLPFGFPSRVFTYDDLPISDFRTSCQKSVTDVPG